MKPLAIIGGLLVSIVFAVLTITCSGKGPSANLLPASTQTTSATTGLLSSAPSLNLPLRTLRDVPLSGKATRFDYQSLDANTGRLYIAHLGDGSMVVFDTNKETLIGEVTNLPWVHGVLAVPELHRVYASATGSNELAVIAFDKGFGRLYVSAESGIVSIFDERGRNLEKVGENLFAPNAHSVAVDNRTHCVYFPLQNVGGKPLLRIAIPSDKQL